VGEITTKMTRYM